MKLQSSLLFAGVAMVWSVSANAQDPSASRICIQNFGGFVMKAGTGCSGDFYSDQTENYPNPQQRCIDLKPYFASGKLANGASCWAIANIALGSNNHGSGQNYTFDKDSSSTANYDITGTTLNPSFHFKGTSSNR